MNNYNNLINKDKQQIFLFKTRANFPFIFASHSWFIVNDRGDISRWEISFSKKIKKGENWGHLYKNLRLPTQGLEIFPYFYKIFWKSKLIEFYENDNVSDVISFIQDSPNNYPYLYKYKLIGPNSNTYIQWVINNYPILKFKLPRNAIGRFYKKQKLNNGII